MMGLVLLLQFLKLLGQRHGKTNWQSGVTSGQFLLLACMILTGGSLVILCISNARVLHMSNPSDLMPKINRGKITLKLWLKVLSAEIGSLEGYSQKWL
jgi:hypothetical protein